MASPGEFLSNIYRGINTYPSKIIPKIAKGGLLPSSFYEAHHPDTKPRQRYHTPTHKYKANITNEQKLKILKKILT